MQENRAFWKAIHSLTHPLSVIAILLLLFNDHWLRYQQPSWLTGKLGDFTWLLFAPFITALLFSWLIPHKHKHQTQLVGLLSIGFIGIWFATAKTIPAIHQLTTDTLALLVGYRGTLRIDVTDLLTLPVLLISVYIWWDARDTALNTKPIGYALFGLAILGTLASDSPYYYNTAIETICELEDGQLLTSYTSDRFYPPDEAITEDNVIRVSDNGGLQWKNTDTLTTDDAIRCSDTSVQTAQHPDNGGIIYRWEKGKYVEKSLDAGAVWTRIHNLPELEQDIRQYSNHDPIDASPLTYEPEYILSPVSGLVHSETGNLVLAMSRDGVLVITPNDMSYWVAVDRYQVDNLQNIELLDDALIAHRFLLPTLWLLIMVSVVTLIHSQRAFTKLWLGIGWAHWALLVIFSHKVFDYIYAETNSTASDFAFLWGLSALASTAFIALPMVIWAGYNLFTRYGRAVIPILVTCITATLAYALPIAMWTQGLIPRYFVAAIFALLLVACVLASCHSYYRDKLPRCYEVEKPKRKEKPKTA